MSLWEWIRFHASNEFWKLATALLIIFVLFVCTVISNLRSKKRE
jgi:hypothetical protein